MFLKVMQKIVTISFLLLLGWMSAWADNLLQVHSTQGHPGEEVTVSVSLEGDEMPTAVELNIPLDDALKFVAGSAALNEARSNGHQLAAAMRNGMLNIVVFTPTLKSLQGTTGELCNFKLKLGKEPADYTLTPHVVMSAASGTEMPATVRSGVVTLLSPKLEVVTQQIDFGHIPIRSVYTKNLTLRNVGNEMLEVTQVLADREDLEAKTQNYSIAPGTSQNVVLTYAPMARGAMTSQVKITSNAINSKAGVATVVAVPFSVNELHVQRAEGLANEEVTVVLKMNNMEPITGAQCEFEMPEELVYVAGSATLGSRCEGADFVATGVVQGKRLSLL